MMASTLMQTPEIQRLLDRVSGMTEGAGDPRAKQILRRIVGDLYATIDEFDISPAEFWAALGFLQQGAGEFGLIAPGLGFDRFLDIREDAKDEAAGRRGGTARAIEGPLYVPGAPLAEGFARLDDGADTGEVLVMHGRVLDTAGAPIAGAVVDVWHANTMGAYSVFDPSQSAYNNRRRIETGADGAYRFRSVVPKGYAVPPNGATEQLLAGVGRHGQRPAHIHFFVSAPPRHRHLTTQINIADDPLVNDDFAQATRGELIPDIVRHTDAADIRAQGLNTPYAEIAFDFVLETARAADEAELHARPRAPAPA
jgi:catechol 1,2-dioxygenase